MSKTHPGFKAVAAGMSVQQHIPLARAQAELAWKTRHASASARRSNPRLKRVKGG